MNKKSTIQVIIACLIIVFIITGGLTFYLWKKGQSIPKVAQLDIAAPNGGKIIKEASLNSNVKKGQIVLEIDPKQYIAQKEADMQTLLDDAQKYERYMKLAEESNYGVVSEQTLESAKYTMLKDKATVDLDKQYILLTKVKAPFDGSVTNIVNYPGSGVGNGNEIMDITASS